MITPSDNPVTIPKYPRGGAYLLVPEQAGSMEARYSVISRYDRATAHGCVFTTTRLDAQAFASAPEWRDSAGDVQAQNSIISLDHACEFFYNLLSNDKTDIHQTKRVG